MIVKWGEDLRHELLCSQLLEQFRVSVRGGGWGRVKAEVSVRVRVGEWYIVLKHCFTSAHEGSELERSYCVFYWVFA